MRYPKIPGVDYDVVFVDQTDRDTGEDLGLDLLKVHPNSWCEGEVCAIHHPSAHHMATWTQMYRADRRPPVMERICAHNLGHPDPDDLTVLRKDGAAGVAARGHPCDGCCIPPA